jgi:tripartite-type tricarboxylate transporter receptor subunit TctC
MILAAAVAATAFLAAGSASGQSFPNRPLRIDVPIAAGGNLDVTTRIVADRLSKVLAQNVVIENRPGAGGVIGAEWVARAEPNGYTLVAGTTGSLIVSPLLVAKPPFSLDDFAPVGMMAVTALVVEVPAGSRFKDFKSFLAQARAQPAKITMGHSGLGTTNHIAVLLLQQAADVQFTLVPYKGQAPVLTDLMGGQIDATVDQISSSLQHVVAGKLRPLAVTSGTRARDLPDVPTAQELGLKDFEVVTPSGLAAPAKTPPAVIATLSDALIEAVSDPAVKKRLAELGSEAMPRSSQAFAKMLREEAVKLQALVKAGVLKAQ